MVAVWPLVSAAFHRPNSELIFSSPDVSISEVTFFVNNRGDRPGVLKNLRLKLPDGNSLLLFVSHGGGVVIPPNDSRYVELATSSFDGDKALFDSVTRLGSPQLKNCSAEFSIANFQTGDAKFSTGLDCVALQTLSAVSATQRTMQSLRPKAGQAFKMVYCDPNCMKHAEPPAQAPGSGAHGTGDLENASSPTQPAQ